MTAPMTEVWPRRSTEREWITHDPILATGELGVATDVGAAKVGDGVRPWRDLPWTIKPGSDIGWLLPLRVRR